MKKYQITWKNEGWFTLQEADPVKHVLEVSCRAEGGMIVEVRIRHSRGEEAPGRVTRDGVNVLPIAVDEFRTLYNGNALDIR